MPIVIVEQTAGRSEDQKREVAKGITDAFVRAYGLKPEQVTIFFHDLERSDMAKAGVLYSDLTST
jgi:4-oxalocrotonate tautomerase